LKSPFFNSLSIGRSPLFLRELVMIFPLVFCVRDFNSGIIKNVYSGVNKFYYVLSKIICILLYALVLYIVYFLTSLLIHLIFYNNKVYVPTKLFSIHFGFYIVQQLLIVLAWVAMGCVVMLITILCKKEFISAIVILPYGLYVYNVLTTPLQNLLNYIYKSPRLWLDFVTFQPFRLSEKIFETAYYQPGMQIFMNWMYVVAIVGYIGLSLLLSWLLVRKKNV